MRVGCALKPLRRQLRGFGHQGGAYPQSDGILQWHRGRAWRQLQDSREYRLAARPQPACPGRTGDKVPCLSTIEPYSLRSGSDGEYQNVPILLEEYPVYSGAQAVRNSAWSGDIHASGVRDFDGRRAAAFGVVREWLPKPITKHSGHASGGRVVSSQRYEIGSQARISESLQARLGEVLRADSSWLRAVGWGTGMQ
jgi:hypothetical protein